MALDSARALVQEELAATDKFIISQLHSPIPLINQMVEYILQCGGKRIRPLVLLLSAKAFQHHNDHPVQLAAVIELIHTATLLHDDVVDNSSLRRGHKTANMVWGNEASVLVGDFLYSRAFQIVVDLRHQHVLDIFARATHYIAEGEILQLVHAHSAETTENIYFDVIHRKTAKLFEIAAELGIATLERAQVHMKFMREYGTVLDYAEQTGKSVGNDIAEGKTTLPMIHALRNSTKTEAALLRKAIETGDTHQLPAILEIIESTGAIEYTAQIAKQHAHKACSSLAEVPASPYRQALHDLAEFVVARSY
jgi:octaprenyl-diphosphate synthase